MYSIFMFSYAHNHLVSVFYNDSNFNWRFMHHTFKLSLIEQTTQDHQPLDMYTPMSSQVVMWVVFGFGLSRLVLSKTTQIFIWFVFWLILLTSQPATREPKYVMIATPTKKLLVCIIYIGKYLFVWSNKNFVMISTLKI